MIRLTFIRGNEAIWSVKWPAVPRVGDMVDMSTVNPEVKRPHKVILVAWRHIAGELLVEVYLEEK